MLTIDYSFAKLHSTWNILVPKDLLQVNTHNKSSIHCVYLPEEGPLGLKCCKVE